jgi:hypothetical protein
MTTRVYCDGCNCEIKNGGGLRINIRALEAITDQPVKSPIEDFHIGDCCLQKWIAAADPRSWAARNHGNQK